MECTYSGWLFLCMMIAANPSLLAVSLMCKNNRSSSPAYSIQKK